MNRSFQVLLGLMALVVAAPCFGANFDVKQDAEGVTVTVDGKLMTRYLIKSGVKPIMWPLVGPTGKEMTRGYPMRDALPTEKADHPHQRSFWFTHGDVDGINFWAEPLKRGSGSTQPGKQGEIVHREFVKVAGGKQAVIVTRNDWMGPDGKRVCEDRRAFTFDVSDKARWIDCDLAVKASDGPVKFVDTKEGSFGVRVAGTMNVDAKLGGKIVNSEGQTDAGAWGKRAPWVDYYGPVQGEIVGIAIMNHPTSFRYPTYWHVRTYGLFTANPFGVRDFTGDKNADGTYTLPAGETMRLRYRVLLHVGDAKEGKVAESFQEYAKLYQGGN